MVVFVVVVVVVVVFLLVLLSFLWCFFVFCLLEIRGPMVVVLLSLFVFVLVVVVVVVVVVDVCCVVDLFLLFGQHRPKNEQPNANKTPCFKMFLRCCSYRSLATERPTAQRPKKSFFFQLCFPKNVFFFSAESGVGFRVVIVFLLP